MLYNITLPVGIARKRIVLVLLIAVLPFLFGRAAATSGNEGAYGESANFVTIHVFEHIEEPNLEALYYTRMMNEGNASYRLRTLTGAFQTLNGNQVKKIYAEPRAFHTLPTVAQAIVKARRLGMQEVAQRAERREMERRVALEYARERIREQEARAIAAENERKANEAKWAFNEQKYQWEWRIERARPNPYYGYGWYRGWYRNWPHRYRTGIANVRGFENRNLTATGRNVSRQTYGVREHPRGLNR